MVVVVVVVGRGYTLQHDCSAMQKRHVARACVCVCVCVMQKVIVRVSMSRAVNCSVMTSSMLALATLHGMH